MTTKKRPAARPRESAREEARGAYREAILAAAERVFAKSGFYATRMADIAREAGVAVGTLYNYFDSREVILSDLLSLRHREFHAKVVAAADASDPVARLRQIVETCFGLIDENGALFTTFMERGAVGEYDLERILGERADSEYGEFLTLLDKTVRACVREKKMRGDVEPRLIVSMLSGAMNGATYAWLKRGRKGRLTSVTGELFELFLQGASSQ
ncbi:MAG TPA: TetR/AcrR family transcriptional regulator [Polyangiaceae bacterium]|nr:TetR/AcrR family transcriptional regulator [Polyangiaceae bacterium]